MKTKLFISNKVLCEVIFICGLMIITSCSSVKGIFGKNSSKEDKQATKIENVEKAQNKNVQNKLDSIGYFAYGIQYSLSKVNTNDTINVAYNLNERVISLANQPTVNQIKEMQLMVDKLISQSEKEKKAGEVLLAKKDAEIQKLQTESKLLASTKDAEIEKYITLAHSTALKADTQKAELDEYKGWFGLKAIGKGFVQLFTTSIWFIVGLVIIFIVLKLLSASSPIAASIFSIFETAGSWVINTVKALVPKAATLAKTVSTSLYNESQTLLTKIVDSIQWIKEQEKATGKEVTIKQLLEQLDKTMDTKEKDQINKIKKDLGY